MSSNGLKNKKLNLELKNKSKIKENSYSRQNQHTKNSEKLLKVLSNRSWGISTKTLMQIYNSLIRSLMEYSSIIYPLFSISNLELLERIQFKCLKIINRKSKYASNIEVKNLDGFVSIEDRFDELNLRYIRNSLSNNNELIIDLLSEFKRYSSSRILNKQTLFCKYLSAI